MLKRLLDFVILFSISLVSSESHYNSYLTI